MGNKIKVLIIGCGRIGALYDFKKEGIKTHVKAFSLNKKFETTVFDRDKKLAKEVATYYKISYLPRLGRQQLSQFEVVVISTPTKTHYDYLKKTMRLNIPVIVCEKPIADSLKQLGDLKELKKKSASRILINYFRRFHPTYKQLKEYIEGLDQKPANIQVTYQRGFLNNATHALDLLGFLLGPSKLKKIKIGSYTFDEFKDDPTVSLVAEYGSVPLSIQGLQQAGFSFFEIRIWFKNILISIEKSGESVRVYSAGLNDESSYYLPLEKKSSPFDEINAIQDAFSFLVTGVENCIDDPSIEDNFESSYLVNYQSLKIIKKICLN